MTRRGLEVLEREECEQLLATTNFGRIVTKVGDTIAAFPVFYALIDGKIVFRTDPGTKLAAAVLHTRVSFEVDDVGAGWSVMAFGFAEEVRSPIEIERDLNVLETHWPEGERQRIVRIDADRVTGRRLRSST